MAKLNTKTKKSEVKTEEAVAEAAVETPVTQDDELVVDTTVPEPPTNVVDEESEIEDETSDEQENDIEVNTEVDESKKPEEMTRVRLRVNHSCCVAMEFYDFKAGQVYHVPKNVKRILNEAGLLAPL